MMDTKDLRRLALDGDFCAIHALLDRFEEVEKARDALRLELAQLHKEADKFGDGIDWIQRSLQAEAKIAEMGRQEPVRHEFQGRDGDWYPFIDQRHYEYTVADGSWTIRPLYALPGAQPAPSVPDGVAEALQRLIENGAVLGPASSEDALLVARYRQRLLACAPSVPNGWLRAIDEALVVAHIGVANAEDTYEQAKAKLDNLIGLHVDIATDQAVNGGWKLVPIEPTPMMKTAGIGVEVYQDSPPSSDCLTWEEAEAIYTAMLAAAPEAKP